MQLSKTINGVGSWSVKISRSPDRRNIRWTDMKRAIKFTCLLALLSPLTSRGSNDAELIDAVKKGYISEVKTLLAEGANVNAKVKNGMTALMAATGYGGDANIEIVRELLTRGADVNAKVIDTGSDSMTVLMIASMRGITEIVRELLVNGADVNAKNNFGGTALMYATDVGQIEVVKELLANDAYVNVKADDGTTALKIAEKKGHSMIAQLLKNAGAR